MIVGVARDTLGAMPRNRWTCLQMLAEHGPIETARRLVTATNESEEFTRLWELQRLDLTVEAVVLRPEFVSLFDDTVRRQAQLRLERYGDRC